MRNHGNNSYATEDYCIICYATQKETDLYQGTIITTFVLIYAFIALQLLFEWSINLEYFIPIILAIFVWVVYMIKQYDHAKTDARKFKRNLQIKVNNH